MSKPIVAIVGRPNVGKSTLFNRIAGRRIAIVEDSPGVTRDRIFADAEWTRYQFTLIDTGGIEPTNEQPIFKQMRRQAELAMDMADVILFLVDGQDGMVPSDQEVANLLRRTQKPVLLVVNKVESFKQEEIQYDFYSLGMDELFVISAQQGLGIGDLLDGVVAHFDSRPSVQEDEALRVAVVGKPNVGKSSMINALLGHERAIVSDVAGTTRDALDTRFVHEGREYVLIDTAGIRKKSRIEDESVERYSVVRSLAAVRRCDVALVLIDATQGITEQDTKIAGYVHDEGKASVLLFNKWDAVEKDTHTIVGFRKAARDQLIFMPYARPMFVSALTGQRVHKILQQVDAAYEQYTRRITTGLLNDILGEALLIQEPPMKKGRRLKVYYATQVSIKPPTFVLFVNDPDLMHFSYLRYLENNLRKAFGFEGTPIRILLRARKDEK